MNILRQNDDSWVTVSTLKSLHFGLVSFVKVVNNPKCLKQWSGLGLLLCFGKNPNIQCYRKSLNKFETPFRKTHFDKVILKMLLVNFELVKRPE